MVVQKRKNKMRYDYSLYLIAIICFVLAGFLFMGYAGYIELTTGNEATDLVVTMFSAVLGVVFLGIGYGVRPKKTVPTQPRKKAVRKRHPKKKT